MKSILSYALAIVAVVFVGQKSLASFANSTQMGMKTKEHQINLVNSLSYGVSSDALDNNKQKVFNHGISYNGTLFFAEHYYAMFGLGGSYTSVNNSITQDDNGYFHLSDLSIGLGTNGFSLYKSEKDSLTLYNNIYNVIPLSESSRNEGYKSVPSVSGDLAYSRGNLSLVLSGQYTYVLNSYETDTTGFYNIRTSTVGSLTARYNYQRFRFQYSYRFGALEYMDGNRLGSSGNSFSIMALFNKGFWAGVSTSNLSYINEQFVDVWFYDPYRRIYNLRLGVTF